MKNVILEWKPFLPSICFLVLTGFVSAQVNVLRIDKILNPVKEAVLPDSTVHKLTGQSLVYISDFENILQDNPPGIILQFGDILPAHNITLPETISLEAFDILLPGTQLNLGTPVGDRKLDFSSASYKGVIGEKGWINLSFTRNGLIGLLQWENKTYIIQPSLPGSGNAGTGEYVIRETSEQDGAWCGVDTQTLSPQVKQFMASLKPEIFKSANSQLTAKLAVETDYETYVSFGKDSLLTTAYLLNLIAGVSQVYESEVNIKLQVVYSRIWTTADDPYTQFGFDLYPEFAEYWRTKMQSIERDAAVLIIKDPARLGGGMAGLDAVCDKNNGYAITGESILLIAHELGHTFGSPHTHNCAWPAGPNGTPAPIDQCATVEGGCSNEIVSQEGTIMSYCQTMNMVFHPLCRNYIRARAEASSCIGNGTEQVNKVSGKVISNGTGLAGVKIFASRFNGNLVSTTTNAEGAYTFTLVTGIYSLSAETEGYLISPRGFNSGSAGVIVAGVDMEGVDFDAIQLLADQYEPDDDFNKASLITTDGTIQNHTLHTDTDYDFVRFEAVAGRTYSIDLHLGGTTHFPLLTLLDTDGITGITNTVNPSHLEWKAPGDGIYFVRINGSKGIYNLTVSTAFSKVNPAITPLMFPSADWGDYDNDGDPDLLAAGMNYNYAFEIDLYNNKNGQLEKAPAAIEQISTSSAYTLKWIDIDNDGDLDAFIGTWNFACFYINDKGSFPSKKIVDDGLGELQSADFGDYDKDGDLDILTLSWSNWGQNEYLHPSVYINNKGNFTKKILNIRGANYGKAKWTDYDGDGDLDIIVVGSSSKFGDPSTSSDDPVAILYRNDNGNFVEVNSALKPVSASPDFVLGDFDNDGDPDLAIAGMQATKLVSRIYRNDNGIFTDSNAELTGVRAAKLAWGDYDNDGDLDLLLTGLTRLDVSAICATELYINEGGKFEAAPFSAFFTGITGTVNWFDFDNDSDLDLSAIGQNENMQGMANLFRNESLTVNAPPSAPSGLSSVSTNGNVTLSWSPAQDDRTPAKGLTYNLRIGTSPGGIDFIAPMSDLNTGWRQVTGAGNIGQSATRTLYNLPSKKYYWSVQAIDNSFAGSLWSTEQSFTINNTVGLDPVSGYSALYKISPNPTRGVVNIESVNGLGNRTEVLLISSKGEEIIRKEINDEAKFVIDLSNQNNGVYFLKISNNDRQYISKVVVLR